MFGTHLVMSHPQNINHRRGEIDMKKSQVKPWLNEDGSVKNDAELQEGTPAVPTQRLEGIPHYA